MGMTSSLCLNVDELITISHNVMDFCFEIFDMVVFALDTYIIWTRFTKVLCVPWTQRTRIDFIYGACFVHDVTDLGLKLKTWLMEYQDLYILNKLK